MTDKIFRILLSIFIAFIAGLICLIPSYYIASEISNLSKDSPHPNMPIGPALASILFAIIIFFLVFYLAFKKNERIISWFRYKVYKRGK
jgi:hypothetical protein